MSVLPQLVAKITLGNRCHWGLQEGIEVSETFDVQHVDLMD
jgi:hypothetical protein